MKYPVLNINKYKYKRIGEGAHGIYYRLNKSRGIKIIKAWESKTAKEAADYIRNTWDEAMALKRAYKTGITPKLHKVCVAQFGKKFYPAILMQHFENYVTFDKAVGRYGYYSQLKFAKKLKLSDINHINEFYNMINDILEDKNLYHNDLHGNNVLVKVQKNGEISSFKLIDLAALDW